MATQTQLPVPTILSQLKDIQNRVKDGHDLLLQVPSLCILVEQNYLLFKSSDKKTLLIQVLTAIADKCISDPTEKAISDMLIEKLVPSLIDEVITVANSQTFKKIKSRLFKCCSKKA